MKDRIREAFGDIQADEALIKKTAAYLQAAREAPAKPRRRARPLRMAAALCALLVLAVGAFGYQTFYASAAAYVSLDVNPSVELALNQMGHVIDAVAYNAQGEALLRELPLRGKSYGDAAASLIEAMERAGYITGNALVTLTVQATDSGKEQALCDALTQLLREQLGPAASSIAVEVFPVTREVRDTAHGCHMSAAKYLAIQELLAVDQTATLEQYSGSTIRQIRRRTQACRQGQGDAGAEESHPRESSAGQANDHHHTESSGQGGGHGYRGGR